MHLPPREVLTTLPVIWLSLAIGGIPTPIPVVQYYFRSSPRDYCWVTRFEVDIKSKIDTFLKTLMSIDRVIRLFHTNLIVLNPHWHAYIYTHSRTILNLTHH